MTNYLAALLICIIAAMVEAACAGRDPMTQLQAMRQPSWAPPSLVWVLVGIAWYVICFVALSRLLTLWPASRPALVLLVVLMLANGAANILLFRMKRLDLAFFFLFPYWTVLGAFLWISWPLDRFTGGLFAIYAVYQVYAACWGYVLWRMNPSR